MQHGLRRGKVEKKYALIQQSNTLACDRLQQHLSSLFDLKLDEQ